MTPEQYAYYMQQWYEADPEAYKAAYEQYEAQLAASQQTQPEAESDEAWELWYARFLAWPDFVQAGTSSARAAGRR